MILCTVFGVVNINMMVYGSNIDIQAGNSYTVKACGILTNGSIDTDNCDYVKVEANDDASIDFEITTTIDQANYDTTLITVEDESGTEVRSSVISAPCEGDTQTAIGIDTVTSSVSDTIQAGLGTNSEYPILMTAFANSLNTSDDYEDSERVAMGAAIGEMLPEFINSLKSNNVSDVEIEAMETELACSTKSYAIRLNDYGKAHQEANAQTDSAEANSHMADAAANMIQALVEAGGRAGIETSFLDSGMGDGMVKMSQKISSSGLSSDALNVMNANMSIMQTRWEAHVDIYEQEKEIEALTESAEDDATIMTMITNLETQLALRLSKMEDLTETKKDYFMNPMSYVNEMTTFEADFSTEMGTIKTDTTDNQLALINQEVGEYVILKSGTVTISEDEKTLLNLVRSIENTFNITVENVIGDPSRIGSDLKIDYSDISFSYSGDNSSISIVASANVEAINILGTSDSDNDSIAIDYDTNEDPVYAKTVYMNPRIVVSVNDGTDSYEYTSSTLWLSPDFEYDGLAFDCASATGWEMVFPLQKNGQFIDPDGSTSSGYVEIRYDFEESSWNVCL